MAKKTKSKRKVTTNTNKNDNLSLKSMIELSKRAIDGTSADLDKFFENQVNKLTKELKLLEKS